MELETTNEFMSILYDYYKMIELANNYDPSDYTLRVKCPNALIYIDELCTSVHEIAIDIIFMTTSNYELQLQYSRNLKVLAIYINSTRPYKVLDRVTYPKYIESFISEIIDDLHKNLNIMNQFIQQPKRVN